jgi:hypothetical protein
LGSDEQPQSGMSMNAQIATKTLDFSNRCIPRPKFAHLYQLTVFLATAGLRLPALCCLTATPICDDASIYCG